MTDSRSPSPLAAFRGSVICRRTPFALILAGPAADSDGERLFLTFTAPTLPDLPDSLTGPVVRAIDARHYRITSGSRDWIIEAGSVHLHRDIGDAFYRAVPPRPVPLMKRLLWGVVLALAHTSTGKRVLLAIRHR